mmetsp:Transcript_22687/g.27827  ORF Transcript_22687/g.27827 Transcript_22687/m.27827 type:complete len:175 (-) Transcript_22687:407-931(-)
MKSLITNIFITVSVLSALGVVQSVQDEGAPILGSEHLRSSTSSLRGSARRVDQKDYNEDLYDEYYGDDDDDVDEESLNQGYDLLQGYQHFYETRHKNSNERKLRLLVSEDSEGDYYDDDAKFFDDDDDDVADDYDYGDDEDDYYDDDDDNDDIDEGEDYYDDYDDDDEYDLERN